MSYTYNAARVSEILREEPSSLKDLCEVEDIIAKIKEIDKNVQLYKDQKTSRTNILNKEIKGLEATKEKLKQIIKMTLDSHDEDSLSFPQVGIVKKKSGSYNWKIKDENALLDKLKEKLKEDQLEGVIVNKPKLVKKEVDKLLSEWKEGGTWPDGVEELVDLEVSPDSIAISLDKGLNPRPQSDATGLHENQHDGFFDETPDIDKEKSLDDILGEITEDDL